MKRFVPLFGVLAITGCMSTPSEFRGEYDGGTFEVVYSVPYSPPSVFTKFHRSLSEDAGGLIYATSDAPTGFFDTTPGKEGVLISAVPATAFSSPVGSPQELIAALKQYAAEKLPERSAAFTVEVVGRNERVRVEWKEKKSGLTIYIVWYTAAADGYWVLASYDFYPGLSDAELKAAVGRTRLAVSHISVEKKEPKKLLLPAPAAGTPTSNAPVALPPGKAGQ